MEFCFGIIAAFILLQLFAHVQEIITVQQNYMGVALFAF